MPDQSRDRPLTSRLRPYTSTIFAEMSALAHRTGSYNLGQGFPDGSGPEAVLRAAQQAIARGQNQYPPGQGSPRLREAVAQQREQDYGLRHDPDTEVLVTMGATEAIASALLSLCEPAHSGAPADEVVIFEPFYDSYPAGIAMAGAQRRVVTLRPASPDPTEGHVTFDPSELAAAITPRTRAILLNSPHNPTGSVFRRGELEAIAEQARVHDLIVITDEVYEHLTYDGQTHIPIATLPGMAERTLSISSAGKTFSITGWKVGWACGPAELVAATRTAKQFLTFSGGAPLQEAVALGLRDCREWVTELRADLQRRRDLLRGALAEYGIVATRSEGSYFLQVDTRQFGIEDAQDFCWRLPEGYGMAAIPSAAFYDHPEVGRSQMRLTFCKNDETITAGAMRLGRAAEQARAGGAAASG